MTGSLTGSIYSRWARLTAERRVDRNRGSVWRWTRKRDGTVVERRPGARHPYWYFALMSSTLST